MHTMQAYIIGQEQIHSGCGRTCQLHYIRRTDSQSALRAEFRELPGGGQIKWQNYRRLLHRLLILGTANQIAELVRLCKNLSH